MKSIINQNEYKVNNNVLYFEWVPSVIVNRRIEYVFDLDNKQFFDVVNNNNLQRMNARDSFANSFYGDDSLISSSSTLR